jgi:predicted small lipoprotein YifL
VVTATRSNVYRIALAGALIAALSLSACGRKGALEAPPHANLSSDTDKAASPGAGEEKSKKPDRKFFLDPLI